LLLCCNQLINIAAKVKYLSNGANTCPFVVRAITGRSWGQGSQHSQSFHSLFSNIPGLRVLCPATPNDAFNCYLNVFRDHIPTVIVEHRMLYSTLSSVSASSSIPSVSHLTSGDNLTLCSFSHMTLECQKAVKSLSQSGFYVDHFSIVDLSNIDIDALSSSAIRTGKLVVVDHGWLTSSIADTVIRKLFQAGFKGDFEILGYADTPCPTSRYLEGLFYPSAQSIFDTCARLCSSDETLINTLPPVSPEIQSFKGPF